MIPEDEKGNRGTEHSGVKGPVDKPNIENDESVLCWSDGQYKVWRKVGKELDPKNTITMVKYGRLGDTSGGAGELTYPNVIEKLWSQLEKSVHEHAIMSKEDIKDVFKERTKIIVETTKKLVESMPRLQIVIKTKGFATKY
ncbi:hypothetical protein TNCV_3173801 [Trichonephila clavipes]|nr:hypothetical protein TNCV_3173801 [Trichonephila clavipes]